MVMDENPYEAPLSKDRVIGIRSGRRADLRSIANAQKGILVCILIQILSVPAQFLLPPSLRIFVGILYLVVAVAATVFVFSLAIKVYSTGVGILLGILTLVPCLGLLILLMVNGKATKILQQNGYRVGLLGANLSDFPPESL